ncbi:hypothetical protein D0T51_12180, partial [Parabacteroides sp. 52]|nr:hypothetical protein [Parabacteroides sp. 52]
FELTLPANVKCTGVESMNAIAYGAPTISGQTATILITSNGGTIPAFSTVRLKLDLKAGCGAVSGSSETILVKPLSGGIAIAGANKDIQAQFISPSIMIKADKQTEAYSGKNEFKTLTYKLSAAGAVAKTYKVILNVDAYTTLQTFKLDGVSKTAEPSSDGKTYTLSLSDLSTTEQVLTFEAASSRLGEHLVTPTAQYPAASACQTESGQEITMSLPSVSGSVTMTHISTSYVDSNDDPITVWETNMDGQTKNMVKVVYQNDGTLPAWDVVLDFGRSCNYAYIDKGNIKYQIGNGEKKDIVTIQDIATVANSIAFGYFPDCLGKPYRVEASLPEGEIIPSGEKITFWVPTVNGKTYDHGTNDVYYDYHTTVINGIANTVKANNEAGEPGSGSAYTINIGYAAVPHFREKPAEFMIKKGEKTTQTIRVSTGLLTLGKGRARVHLQLPAWLKLDTSGSEENFTWSTTVDGSTVQPSVLSDDSGKTPYKVYTGFSSTEGLLSFKYTTDDSEIPAGSPNLKGEIGYYIDYEYNGYWLNNIYQVFQPVNLSLKEEGVVLENLSLYRFTRGLEDRNEDHIPDSNKEALDEDINHSYYMLEDKGEFRWNTRIVDASCKYLYLPVTTNELTVSLSDKSNQYLSLLENEVEVKIGGNTQNYQVSVVVASTTQFYVKIDASSSPWQVGDLVDIYLPFIAKNATTTIRTFASECFVSNKDFTNPFDSKGDAERKGEDIRSYSISTYGLEGVFWPYYSNSYLAFNNEEQKGVQFYFNIFHNNPSAPYFEKEVRRHAYPKELEVTLPDGYVMYNDNKIEVIKQMQLDGQGPSSKILTPEVNGNTYTYNLSLLYDHTFNVSGDALDPDKWMLPDDRWQYTFTFPVQVTKGATLGTSIIKPKLIYYDLSQKKEKVIGTGNFTFDYQGVATSLNLSTPSLNSYGSSLTLPVITVGNPNETALGRVWLYVDGNVSDLTFTEQGGSPQAVSGKWFSVNSGSGLAAASNAKYQLDFKHLGRLDGKNENDTIWVYTVSDFGDTGYTDPTSAPLDVNDLEHVGARRPLVIIPAPAKISGSLSVDNPSITYNTPYTLTAIIDGTVSQGVVRNPKLTLEIPMGQDYEPNTLSIVYNGQTYTSTSPGVAALEGLLVGGNGTATDGPAALRTVEVDLETIVGAPVLFPGTLSSDPLDTDAKRKATVTAQFKPMCKTDLTGSRIKGNIGAGNITGTISKLSQSLLPALSTAYGFEVRDAEIVGGNRALNELQTTLTLKATVIRNADSSTDIEQNDYVLVKVPEQLSLNGTAQISSSSISGAAGALTEVEASSVTAGIRSIKLALPRTAINGDGSKGFGKEMVYEIPLVWDPDYTTALTSPTPILEVKYITSAAFDSDCSAGDVTLGETSIGIAILAASANPYQVTVDEEVTMNITTGNFDGKWYSDSNLGTEVSAVNPYTLTPSVVGDVDYYVSAIIDGEDYGSVRVQLKVYPSLDFSVVDAAICPAGSIDLSTLVSGDAVASGTTTVL